MYDVENLPQDSKYIYTVFTPSLCASYCFSVKGIELERAIPVDSGHNAYGVEQCQCPPQYTGLSCQVSVHQTCSVYVCLNWAPMYEDMS